MSLKTNFWLDVSIFIGFLVALEPRMTGFAIHEWFTVASVSTLIIHFLLHWDWFIKMTKKFATNFWHSSRLNYILSILIFVGFITIITSGLMISQNVLPFFGFTHNLGGSWRGIHNLTSNLTFILVAVHVALRWDWVKNTFTKLFSVSPKKKLNPAPVLVEQEDRS